MESTIEKLQRLLHSVQKLETVLQEVWSTADELGDDEKFKGLKMSAKQTKKQNAGDLDIVNILNEYHSCLEEIPEDGTSAVDFEDAICELMDWLKNNN